MTRAHNRRRAATVLVMTSLFLVFFSSLAALGVDLGWVFVREARLQRAVSAAALAAAHELQAGKSDSSARSAARAFAKANGYEIEDADVTINPNGNNADVVRVSVANGVPLLFGSLLGIKSVPVAYSAWGVAADEDSLVYANGNDPKSPSGVPPLYVPHADLGPVALGTTTTKAQLAGLIFGAGQKFTVGQRYPLKVGDRVGPRLKTITGANAAQHQGVVELIPPGAASMDYAKTLKYGYAGNIAVDDVLNSLDAKLGAESKAGIDFRYNQDSGSTEASAKAYSARMVLVPIVAAQYTGPADRGTGVANYASLPHGYNGAVYVRVIGFGRFFLDPSSTSDDYGPGAISGVFSGYVGTPPNGQTKG